MAGLLIFLLEKGLTANRYTLDRLLAIHNNFNKVVAISDHAAICSIQVPTDLVFTRKYRSVKAVHALTQNVEYVDRCVRRSLCCKRDSYRTVCRVRIDRQARNCRLI